MDNNYLYFQPFHGLTDSELNDEFQTSSDKLKHIIENSMLSNTSTRYYHFQIDIAKTNTLLEMN